MARYKADPEQIAALIATAEQISGRIEERLAQVDQEVAALHVAWAGAAANEHQAKHDEWTRAAREMREAVDELKGDARRAHDSYTTAADHNQGMWP